MTCNLGDAPEYQALSYTWGEYTDQEEIIISEQVIAVASNLRRFLESSRMGTNWWWIDQISIQQSDLVERNIQVSIMSDIYNKASRVVIWLDGISSPTCAMLNIAIARESFVPRSTTLADALEEFFAHPYWSRVWIIQEMVFARNLLITYNRGSVSLRDLTRVLERCKELQVDVPPRISWFIENAVTSGREPRFGLRRLDEMVWTFSVCGCKDSRDKVFAIQGLLKHEHRIPIDYSRPVNEIFFDAVRVMVREWKDENPIRVLISTCMKLGYQMLPDDMALHNVFDRLQTFEKIVNTKDPYERRKKLIDAYRDLLTSFLQDRLDALKTELHRLEESSFG